MVSTVAGTTTLTDPSSKRAATRWMASLTRRHSFAFGPNDRCRVRVLSESECLRLGWVYVPTKPSIVFACDLEVGTEVAKLTAGPSGGPVVEVWSTVLRVSRAGRDSVRVEYSGDREADLVDLDAPMVVRTEVGAGVAW